MQKDSPAERAQKQRNLEEAKTDLEELLGIGYQVHQFMPWHWRITRKPDWRTLEVDVWPTTKKIHNRDSGHVFVYKDMLKAVEDIFKSDRYMP